MTTPSPVSRATQIIWDLQWSTEISPKKKPEAMARALFAAGLLTPTVQTPQAGEPAVPGSEDLNRNATMAACERAHGYPTVVHSKPCSWPACELECMGRKHLTSAGAALDYARAEGRKQGEREGMERAAKVANAIAERYRKSAKIAFAGNDPRGHSENSGAANAIYAVMAAIRTASTQDGGA